jgi:tetratricopeptide (TPR) repeat protein
MQPPPEPQPIQSLHGFFTPYDWIAAAITFLISATLFVYYMSPEVTLQDSGELVTGAFNFGVPHPPGYPLWAFLGWMWRHLIWFGNPAWRICLMSVLTGALVVGVLTLLMTRSILMLLRSVNWAESVSEPIRHWIALTIGASVALLFGFNRGVWLWACVPEMRVLNVFMFIITACTFFAWMVRPQRHGFLYVTILMYSLGISNHQTIVVMALPFVVGAGVVGLLTVLDRPRWQGTDLMTALAPLWELLTALMVGWAVGLLFFAWLQAPSAGQIWSQKVKLLILFGPPTDVLPVVLAALGLAAVLFFVFAYMRWLSQRRALICTAMFLGGAAFYFYMPVASATNPPMNWGFTWTKQGFLHHITRGQYERLNIASPFSNEFFVQIGLFLRALLQQFSPRLGFDNDYLLGLPFLALALLTIVALVWNWRQLNSRARGWLIFVWIAFLITSLGLLTIINPGVDKQNQEINIKFFAPAHGFFAMLIGYGLAIAVAWTLVRWRQWNNAAEPANGVPSLVVRIVCAGCLVLPIISLQRNWRICEQRGHDLGYQFGYRMFYPGGDYPPMERDAVLYGGTDPGRFVPTYMIFCESRVAPKDRYRDPHLDPEGGRNFDRRDVYIITQNALADSTYMSYIRDHYDYSRPDPNNPATLQRREPWQRTLFRWGWRSLYRDSMYPKEPIWIPSEQDTQRAFQEYVNEVQARKARGEQLPADENVTVEGGAVQVRGVAGVMKINGILTRWIFERNRDKHAFYVEESYVIPWMYPFLTPAGIIMKINHDELPPPEKASQLWAEIVQRDKSYWDKLCDDFTAREEFKRDTDAQKTFSKLRSAIGGLYAWRHMTADAEYAFKQALKLCPESPEANFRLAQLYMELGRPDDALATLEALLKLDPLNSKISQAIDQIRGIKQSQLGIPQLEAARGKNPHDFNLVAQLAQEYSRAGQNGRIGPMLQNYLTQTNLSADELMGAAQLYLSANQFDASAATLQMLVERFPQDARGFYALAILRAHQNQQDEALSMLEHSFQLAPALRQQAATDQRFAPLQNNPKFQQLLNSQS